MKGLYATLLGGLLLESSSFALCHLGQITSENFAPTDLPKEAITVVDYENLSDFLSSKPRITGGKIQQSRFLTTDTTYQEVWCKMKTQEAISRDLDLTPQGEPLGCQAFQEAIFQKALQWQAPQVRQTFDNLEIELEFLPDQKFNRGDQWSKSAPSVTFGDGKVTLQATTLRTANWIPYLGGMRYCKTFSAVGASRIIQELIEAPESLDDQNPVQITASGDAVDVYLPQEGASRPAIILLQGAKVEKSAYEEWAKALAEAGFVVAIPNHNSLFGRLMTEQKVVTQVWDALLALNDNPDSALHERIDPDNLAIAGHSLGGVAALNAIQNKCQLPVCRGGFEAPPALKAAMVFGTNTKTPLIGNFAKVASPGIPVLFIQGDQDGIARLVDGQKTFQMVSGAPALFLTIKGMNHYGINSIDNPGKAKKDRQSQSLERDRGLELISTWTAAFLKSQLLDDPDARDFVFEGKGQSPEVNIEIREP